MATSPQTSVYNKAKGMVEGLKAVPSDHWERGASEIFTTDYNNLRKLAVAAGIPENVAPPQIPPGRESGAHIRWGDAVCFVNQLYALLLALE